MGGLEWFVKGKQLEGRGGENGESDEFLHENKECMNILGACELVVGNGYNLRSLKVGCGSGLEAWL